MKNVKCAAAINWKLGCTRVLLTPRRRFLVVFVFVSSFEKTAFTCYIFMAFLQFFRLVLHALVFQQYIKMIKFTSYNKNKTEGAKLNLVVVRKK